jgi:YD repeat-containing protein
MTTNSTKNVDHMIHSNGIQTWVEYDELHRPISYKDSNGLTILTTYLNNGFRKTVMILHNQMKWEHIYDNNESLVCSRYIDSEESK